MAEDKTINEQRNNNTLYENEAVEISKTNKSLRREDVMGTSGSQEISAEGFPRAIPVPRSAHDQRGYVETIRKPEPEVEVLKQKYINNDIQDIPSSFLEGPIRYGRLHRSRSLHVNLASQDIRSQMNKLRFKHGLGLLTTSPRVKFRCSRFTYDSAQHGSKTLEEFLNGDSLNDDYDPELAKLFDDYVEECDQITRGNFKHDTTVLRRLGAIRDPKQATLNDTDTCQAFWRGFAHGISHSKHHLIDESNALDLAIKMAHAQREVIQDPCIDKSSQSDMIRTNQDITHKFLKEWEDQHSNSIINKGNDSQLSCFACNTEKKILKDLLGQKPEVGPVSAQSGENNPNSETKLVVQRNAMHLGKPNRARKLTCHNKNPRACMSFQTSQNDQCGGSKNDVKKKDGTSQIPTETNVQFNHKDACKKIRAPLPPISKKKTRNGSLDDKSTSRSPAKKPEKGPEKGPNPKDQSISGNSSAIGPAGPFMIVRKDGSAVDERSISRSERTSRHERESKDDSVIEDKNQIKKKDTIEKLARIRNALDDTVLKEYQFNDENISIITLAKMKLENKSMSSLGLDDVLMPKRDQIRRCRSEELERDKEHVMMRKILSNLDLDGWESKTKPYCYQDTLHMSSSETLHPVDSLESFPSPSLRRQSCSTPLLTSLEKKHPRMTSNEHTPAASRTVTPDRFISTSAKLSDLDKTPTARRRYETSAFRPNNSIMKNKIAERIKLRLTKSNDSFVEKGGRYSDPAFANIPLARCQSYNIEQKMKSGLTPAPSINLSESLAKQLKEIGKDKDKHKRVTIKEKDCHDDDNISDEKTRSDDHCTFLSKSSFPQLDGKKLLRLSPKESQDDQSACISLPEFGIRKALWNQQSKSQNESLNHDKEVRNQTLPPISGTSLLASEMPVDNVKPVTDNNPNKILNYDEDSELLMNRSFPCRTEFLQTPYTFDKADPTKLLLKAKALPSLHTVCTSCGSINEKHENTSGNEKALTRGVFRAGKDKNIHHRCVTPGNEEKWKLEKSRPNSLNDLPKLGVSNSTGSRKHNKSMKETCEKKSDFSNDYSKYERTKKPSNDEMTFKFLDQNIKLRFEVDLPLEDKRKLLYSISNTSDSSSPRPSNIALSRNQDNVEGLISRETKIYRDKIRQKLLLQNGEHDQTNSSVLSPYVEYCKRKSYLQSLRDSKEKEQYVDLNHDAVKKSPCRSNKGTERFPVIQAKINKESTKKASRTTSRQGKSQKVSSVKQGEMKKRGLRVEPAKLPTIVQQSARSEEKKHSKKQLTKELSDARGQIERKKERLPHITDTIKVKLDSSDSVPRTNTINNNENDM